MPAPFVMAVIIVILAHRTKTKYNTMRKSGEKVAKRRTHI